MMPGRIIGVNVDSEDERPLHLLTDDDISQVTREQCRCFLTLKGEPIAIDPNYISWLGEHPSALGAFNQMINVAKGKQIVVFLDYDGTLSPIVSDPKCAFMSDQMREAVRNVSNCFPTAIISSRSREKVFDFVKLNTLYYSGSHGMDTMGPALKNNSYDTNYQRRSVDKEGNEFIVFQPAQDFLPAVKKILIEVRKRTQHIQGVAIEDNRFCLSVHYRHVKDELKVQQAEKHQCIDILRNRKIGLRAREKLKAPHVLAWMLT